MASSRHSDSWMKECEEAMRLADDVSALVTHRVSMLLSGLDPSRLLPTIRQKLTMLVTKLDRLESLLRNPPVNVNLSDKELRRREDLLLQIRTKTKEIAGSLRVPQASKREDLVAQEGKLQAILQQGNSSAVYDISRSLTVQERATIERAEDPPAPVATGACTINATALSEDEEMNARKPLLVDSEEPSNSSFLQISRIFTYLGRRAEEECSPLYICIVFICFVVFIMLILSIFKIT